MGAGAVGLTALGIFKGSCPGPATFESRWVFVKALSRACATSE